MRQLRGQAPAWIAAAADNFDVSLVIGALYLLHLAAARKSLDGPSGAARAREA